jgi:hypothetical protein
MKKFWKSFSLCSARKKALVLRRIPNMLGEAEHVLEREKEELYEYTLFYKESNRSTHKYINWI